jgi:hypothetical protein
MVEPIPPPPDLNILPNKLPPTPPVPKPSAVVPRPSKVLPRPGPPPLDVPVLL